jgi:hypothetical protein
MKKLNSSNAFGLVLQSLLQSVNSSVSQSVQQMSYSIPRVPPGMTADAIAHAIAEALQNHGTVQVQLVPVNPIFRYGGVQHAARITMPTATKVRDLKVVYDLESQAHFTLLPNAADDLAEEKQRIWRWALRGIVIQ